ncbi:MAG: phosphoglycerate kinase [Candidatus Babeliales bacterium]|jgi:phosphoglycerate kinase
MNFKWLKTLNLNKKRIFLRADLNISLKNDQILQDFKLEAILPTIDFILKNEGKIVLATHIGRPEPGNKSDLLEKSLSTKILIPWFKNRGYNIDYEPDLITAERKSHQNSNSILLLENLRYFVGERENSIKFAELLAATADLYVNDAFGNIHRTDTSTTLLAKQFSPTKRSFGLLIEKELKNLDQIRLNKSDNFVVVLGGIKIKDKIKMLENLMTNTDKQKARAFIIGGGIALAFLKAKGLNVGSIELDEQTLGMAEKILHNAQKNDVEIILPVDQIIKDARVEASMVEASIVENAGVAEIVDVEKIPTSAKCIDIGPQTIKLFSQEIKKASVIFTNGTMGIYDMQGGEVGTQSILQAIADANALAIVGGGDATAATCIFGLQDKMDFLSTGGGATLKYLGCKNPEQEMPGLQAMLD